MSSRGVSMLGNNIRGPTTFAWDITRVIQFIECNIHHDYESFQMDR